MRPYLPLLFGVLGCNAVTGMDGYRNVDSDASDEADAPQDGPVLTTCQECLVQASSCGTACNNDRSACSAGCSTTQCNQQCDSAYNKCTTTCTQQCNGCGTASTCSPTQCSSAVTGD